MNSADEEVEVKSPPSPKARNSEKKVEKKETEKRRIMERGRHFTRYLRVNGFDVDKQDIFLFLNSSRGPTGTLFWCPLGKRIESEENSLPLDQLEDIYVGKQTEVFLSLSASLAVAERCGSLLGKRIDPQSQEVIPVELNLEAPTVATLTFWITGIPDLLKASGKKVALADEMEQGDDEIEQADDEIEQADEMEQELEADEKEDEPARRFSIVRDLPSLPHWADFSWKSNEMLRHRYGDQRMTITTSDKKFQLVHGGCEWENKERYYFEVSLLDTNIDEAYIGVIPSDLKDPDPLALKNEGWSFRTSDGSICHGGLNFPYSQKSLQHNGKARLGVLVDMNLKTISFVQNGERLEKAFENITSSVKPAICCSGSILLHSSGTNYASLQETEAEEEGETDPDEKLDAKEDKSCCGCHWIRKCLPEDLGFGPLCLTKCWDKLFGRKEVRVLMVGLDAAGKTTVLYKLKLGNVITTIPTIGFNVETVNYKNISFTVWDVGGQDKIRPLWRHYYQNTQVIIWVIDGNDRDRFDDSKDYQHSAKEEFYRMMAEDELKDAVVLIYANKQDLPNCMKVDEIREKLGLKNLKNRKWFIQGTSAPTGDGLYEGLDWLVSQLDLKVDSDHPEDDQSYLSAGLQCNHDPEAYVLGWNVYPDLFLKFAGQFPEVDQTTLMQTIIWKILIKSLPKEIKRKKELACEVIPSLTEFSPSAIAFALALALKNAEKRIESELSDKNESARDLKRAPAPLLNIGSVVFQPLKNQLFTRMVNYIRSEVRRLKTNSQKRKYWQCQNGLEILCFLLVSIICGLGILNVFFYFNPSFTVSKQISLLEGVSPFCFGIILMFHLSYLFYYVRERYRRSENLRKEMLDLDWVRSGSNLATWGGHGKQIGRNLVPDLLELPERNYSLLAIFVSFLILLAHCFIPVLMRSQTENAYFGSNWIERLIIVSHIGVGGIGIPLFLSFFSVVNRDHSKLELLLKRVGALMRKPHLWLQEERTNTWCWNERRDNFFWSMNLLNGYQLDFWLKLREFVLSMDPPSAPVIGVLLLSDLLLFIAIFVRVIFLKSGLDTFVALGLVDALSLAFLLMNTLSHIVRSNNELATHHVALATIRYRLALQCERQTIQKRVRALSSPASPLDPIFPALPSAAITPFLNAPVETVVDLLDAAIYKLESYDLRMTVLGIVVDEKFLFQVGTIMLTAAASGVGELFRTTLNNH